MENLGFAKKVPQATVDAAKNGDQVAFECLYSTYLNACYSAALRMIGERKLAEDAVQNSFMKVIDNINSLDKAESFGAWLKRIVINETISILRKYKATNFNESFTDDTQALQEQRAQCFSIDENKVHLEKQAETEWELEKILKKLSAVQRSVLMLHQIEGYKHEEIAQMFNKSTSFSKVTLNRAFKVLRDQVNDQQLLADDRHTSSKVRGKL